MEKIGWKIMHRKVENLNQIFVVDRLLVLADTYHYQLLEYQLNSISVQG